MTTTLTYALEVNFPEATSAGAVVQELGLWDTQEGGNFLGYIPIAEPSEPIQVGERFTVPASHTVISFNSIPAGFTNYWDLAIINLIKDNQTLYLSLHSGTSGSTGANELAGGGYQRQLLTSQGFTVATLG